jgi:hypothetical protein
MDLHVPRTGSHGWTPQPRGRGPGPGFRPRSTSGPSHRPGGRPVQARGAGRASGSPGTPSRTRRQTTGRAAAWSGSCGSTRPRPAPAPPAADSTAGLAAWLPDIGLCHQRHVSQQLADSWCVCRGTAEDGAAAQVLEVSACSGHASPRRSAEQAFCCRLSRTCAQDPDHSRTIDRSQVTRVLVSPGQRP